VKEIEERVDELEIRFTYQARQIEELNEVVTDGFARISHLERENRMLREMLGSLAPETPESPDE